MMIHGAASINLLKPSSVTSHKQRSVNINSLALNAPSIFPEEEGMQILYKVWPSLPTKLSTKHTECLPENILKLN